MTELHFVFAQINPTVGDIDGNTQLILDIAAQYAEDELALLVFPELVITGYPPEDLLTRPAFIEQTMQAVDALVVKSAEFKCSVLVGTVWQEDGLIYNAALLICGGAIKHIHKKNCLPNYGVFDERRYFAQGSAPLVVEHQGQQLGILICEDAWFEHNWQLLKSQGAELLVVINASPFEVGKQQHRLDYFSKRAAQYKFELIYVNMVGAQDDLVFDGASFRMDENGKLVHQLLAFESYTPPLHPPRIRGGETFDYPDDTESIWLAIGLGLKNYINKNHIDNVVIGISGGIDSALVATLAVDVLGATKVHGVLLPSEFTSDASNIDALALAKNLGIKTSMVPITNFVDAAEISLIPELKALGADVDGWREDLVLGGNLQARLRGNILMAYSNALGGVLLNTSNKSEIAVGYSTMYGDACGAYSPLKDVYKTQVYKLANYCNAQSPVIPDNIINKVPTAELRPEQKDSDQLPEYDVLDAILHELIEERLSVQEVAKRGFDERIVQRVSKLIHDSEYKRRQFPPGPKVSPMLFGKDWRYPLSNHFTS